MLVCGDRLDTTWCIYRMRFRVSQKPIARSKKAALFWRGFLLVALIANTFLGSAIPSLAAQSEDPASKAAELLETLTPEERVGQLFLVTFTGTTAPGESQIYDLIADYHIGGVALRRDMNNYAAAPETVSALSALGQQLQAAEVASSETERADVLSGEVYTPSYVPLFIAINQEGDGYPYDHVLDGLSPLPSAMTLGATWNPELARQAGELLGAELSSIGVNMLLGPSLDVLESPRPTSLGDLGVRSFGGDPFWVGQMGQAFISGLHSGSNDSVAVIAKHLPGHGGSNRPVDEEVPTVRKSLTELGQIELPPFFAVTGDAPTPAATADGMLIAHIRYQGFQGNIRDTTRPISLDPQAFGQLMALPQFAEWRAEGGVVVSDNLGTRAIRRNYDPAELTFNAPLVARDAFLAGNDLLYLGNFIANNDADSYTTIRRTVEFFAQKYREDLVFAERVDESVLRVLTMKFKLYPTFDPNAVTIDADAAANIGSSDNLIFEIGRQAATLLSPTMDELANLLPNPPGAFEQIIFVTDSYAVQQCAQCEPQSSISVNAMADAVLGLYGPGAGNQITAANLTSFTFAQLARTLDEQWPDGEDPIAANLPRAEWVVFLLTKEDGRLEAAALRRLLSEQPDLIQNKRVIVFAMNAPYYLDATDITKVTAYYALYSKEDGMTEVAARLLFQEISAPGSSPVTIEGIGYDLIAETSPDDTQVIPLIVERFLPAAQETPTAEAEPSETATAIVYQAGDVVTMQAGPILDHNGHVVADNTPVSFGISLFTSSTTLTRQIAAVTRQGFATSTYSIEAEGDLEIIATSGEPQARSEIARIEVAGINPEGLALQATQTAQAQAMATASAIPPEQTPTPTPVVEVIPRTGFVDWFLIVLVSGVSALFSYQSALSTGRRMRWAIRWGLATLIGGLAVGSYLSFDLPGSRTVLSFAGEWGVVLSVLTGAMIGWVCGWLWREQTLKSRRTNGS